MARQTLPQVVDCIFMACPWPCNLLQIWRPIVGPVKSSPLGLVDTSTVDKSDYLVNRLFMPERMQETYHLKHNPKHRLDTANLQCTKGVQVILSQLDSDCRGRMMSYSLAPCIFLRFYIIQLQAYARLAHWLSVAKRDLDAHSPMYFPVCSRYRQRWDITGLHLHSVVPCRWYYASNMMPDEAYIFVNFDSRTDRARFCPHAAFQDLAVGKEAAARHSVEVRAFCFWENL